MRSSVWPWGAQGTRDIQARGAERGGAHGMPTRACVLVAGDGAEFQHPLSPATVCTSAAQVQENEVVVRAPCRERRVEVNP